MTTALQTLETTVPDILAGSLMKALVYHGPGKRAWEEKPRPEIREPTDAIVRITDDDDLRHRPAHPEGRRPHGDRRPHPRPRGRRRHRGGGRRRHAFQKGDQVLISCITSCGKCDFCRKGMYSHCRHGGWILGQHDRRHPGRVRPHPARGHQPLPVPRGRRRGGAGDAERHPADRLRVRRAERPGEAGRHGGHRRRRADRARGAADGAVLLAGRDHHDRPRRQPARGGASARRDRRRQQRGRQGGRAGHGAHRRRGRGRRHRGGRHPGDVRHLPGHRRAPADTSPTSASTASRWSSSSRSSGSTTSRITTRLVDTVTTPMLLKIVVSGKLQPKRLVTHRFELDDIMKAYDTFANAAKENALKVILKGQPAS